MTCNNENIGIGIIYIIPNNDDDFIIKTQSSEKIETYKGVTTKLVLDSGEGITNYQKIKDALNGTSNIITMRWSCPGPPKPRMNYSKLLDDSSLL